MNFTRRGFVTAGVVSLGASSVGILPPLALAQSPPAGVLRINPSSDETGQADRTAIQGAINTLEAMDLETLVVTGGGIVELAPGTYFIDQRLRVRNRVTIRGTNGRATEIQPGSSFSDTYMFEFRNEFREDDESPIQQVSQFNCRLEELSIRPMNNASIIAAVWGRSWNEQCGLRNVLIWEYMKHAVLFTDGFGGTATFELRECEFMSAGNASTSYPGLFFTTPHTVGYTNAILEHVIVSGPSSPGGYTCIEARNGLNVIATGGHVEQCEYGIYMTNRSNLTLTGFTGSPTAVTNLIGCAGDFSGTVFGSAVLKAGATGKVLRDNKLGNHICVEQNPLVFPTGASLGC
jgi:hypothetical protein